MFEGESSPTLSAENSAKRNESSVLISEVAYRPCTCRSIHKGYCYYYIILTFLVVALLVQVQYAQHI